MLARGAIRRLLLIWVGLCGYCFLRASAGFPRSSSRCTYIPRSMALCYDIGYSEMRIPNLLEHETMAEVIQQSSSWLPLLARECHPDARIFLCSLFAPICLDRIIYPCRSLCESVRDSCAPIMACYGYPWPEILQCDNFPIDHSLCISAISDETTESRRIPRASCQDCELEEARSPKEVLDTFCTSDFAVKVQISRRNQTSSSIFDCDMDSRLEVLKRGPLLPTEVQPRLKQWLEWDATCVHNLMRGTHTGAYIISGEVQGNRLVVNKAYAWNKRNRNLHLAVRKWKHHRCRQ
ncbi:secreted frizzled-related protein 5-like [Monodelphis domestica]|uniref:Secreted frizzled-related protein 1 n=1 Tax=Monodelphis domestica TaxID=13616 RepID=A0A5F8G703_MONDO|nr:secreted frizzled-related protein 5-like [Monodelphis domestica]